MFSPVREGENMTIFESKGLLVPIEGGGWVARNALLCGDVTIGEDSGIWFSCVIRGDDAPITIGRRTNVQDLTMIHADPGVPSYIGDEVTIGHRCVLHGARVEDRSLIGMGAVLLGASVVGEGSIVAAGAVVREGFDVPPHTLVAGVPARVIRKVTDAERKSFAESAAEYVRKIRLYVS
jgi:carbonic anhydrase/acetyltransferase-like protein (isoleucine patch superfamily)